MLAEGDKLPKMTLLDDAGNKVSTSDFVGNGPFVLYFYPKDDTPGCTTEASEFRDLFKQFQKKKATIVGAVNSVVENDEMPKWRLIERPKAKSSMRKIM